jgi:hypothetical protein
MLRRPDLLRSLAYHLLVGGDEARLDRGLRLGAAFNMPRSTRRRSARCRVAFASPLAVATSVPEQSFTDVGYQHWADGVCNGRHDCRFDEKQYGTYIQGRFKVCRARDEETQKARLKADAAAR